jgi:MFS transporter, DHA1 family, multidrug resistance protein
MLHSTIKRIQRSRAGSATTLAAMHPQADTLWRGSRWTLALLLACLGMIGPFAIDTYLPAFSGIARQLGATPVEMQQTLSVYLFAFAAMNLFHGALADSFGRRPVVLAALAVFTLASVGCALSTSIGQLIFFRGLQGLSAGGGMVISRAIVRDLFKPADAQRMMSQITIFFGVAPAIAPLIGGWLFVHADWHSIFWLLAVLGGALTLAMWRMLPESLHGSQVQSFHPAHLLRGYWQIGSSARFLALSLASGVPFNGMFLYILAAPVWLGDHLKLAPTEFFWHFVLSIGGIMAGAVWSGRLAGRVPPKRQIRWGLAIMAATTVVNLALNATLEPHVSWALFPVAVFAFGWSLMVPAVTLILMDLVPERRGMASSVHAFLGSMANGLVAGVLVPLVMHSTLALAAASAVLLTVGLVAWIWVKPQVT